MTVESNCAIAIATLSHWLKTKGGFPLSRNFYVRTDANFNWLYVRQLK